MDFKNMIQGKKVLLLGPASYLYDGTFSEDLSDYNVVIKMNRMVETEICKKFKNDRCDILYHCLDVTPEYGNFKYDLNYIKEKGVNHIRVPFPPLWPWSKKMLNIFEKENTGIINYSVVDESFYRSMKKECKNTMPNTGTIAIFDILRFKPESLTIRGITMFKGGYCSSYRTKNTKEDEISRVHEEAGNHSNEFQNLFIKKEILKHHNVYYDVFFKQGIGL